MAEKHKNVAVLPPGDRIAFSERVNQGAVAGFLNALHDVIDIYAKTEVVLDFSEIDRAYPAGMVPIVCIVDSLRADGIEVGAVLPSKEWLRRLFLNSNWAHLLHPERHPEGSSQSDLHLAVQRFRTTDEQQRVVSEAMDIVMANMELERDLITGLEWSINEITDNVLNHAEAPQGGIVQVSTFRDQQRIAFVVADAGRGILASMQEGFPQLSDDESALTQAIKQGVTRSPEAGQGNGLAGTLRIATGSGGSFGVASGASVLQVWKGPGASEFEEHRTRRRSFQGTVVEAELMTDHPLSLEEVLGDAGIPTVEHDVLDSRYSEGEVFRISIADEAGGQGSRGAGRRLRTKCINLLGAEPTKRLVLDWAGIPLVSSSFADEAVGRLFRELGPIQFGTRIQHVGMEPLVRSLVDRAIMQRAAQSQESP